MKRFCSTYIRRSPLAAAFLAVAIGCLSFTPPASAAPSTAVSRAAPEDLKIFSSMEQLRDGAFEGRLLKPDPLEKDSIPKRKLRALRPEGGEKTGGIIMGRSKPEVPGDGTRTVRRDSITGPAKQGTREQERISKNKQLLREARQAIRQKRRAKK